MTDPFKIMEKLAPWVDRWIVATLNYMGVDSRYYQKKMPRLLEYVEGEGLNVMWKKELRPYVKEEKQNVQRRRYKSHHSRGRKGRLWPHKYELR